MVSICKWRGWARGAAVMTLALVSLVSVATAGDVETAKKKLEEAKSSVKDQQWNQATEAFKEVEAFLEGVPAAEAAPVAKELADLRAAAGPAMKKWSADGIVRTVTRDLDSAANDVTGNPASAAGSLERAAAQLNSPEAKANLDAATAKKLQDRYAGLQTMAMGRLKKQKMEYAGTLIKELDASIAANPMKAAPGEATDFSDVARRLTTEIGRVREAIKGLPPADADVKAINDKLANYVKTISTAMAGADKAGELARIDKWWKDQAQYSEGWQQETAGPKWEEYSKTSSQAMSAFGMPKTVEAISRTTGWLAEADVKKAQDTYKGDPALTAVIADANKTLETAASKLNKSYNDLLAEAEKLPLPAKTDFILNKPGQMADDAARLFDGTKYKDANVARAKKLQEKWTAHVAGGEAGRADKIAKAIAVAKESWPKMAAAYASAGTVDDAAAVIADGGNKGKFYRFDNAQGDSGFGNNNVGMVMRIRGAPVAFKFSPEVLAAWKDAQALLEADPLYGEGAQMIATPDGTCQLNETYWEPLLNEWRPKAIHEKAPQFLVVALHAGPIAVAQGQGSTLAAGGATPGAAGTVAVAGTSAGTGALGWLMRIVWLLVALAAAFLVFAKAKPATVAEASAGNPNVAGAMGYAAPALAGNNTGLIGLALAALGLLWLLTGLIYRDFLPALALTAAGVYLAADFLRARGILPESTANQLRPLGIPIAGAVAVLAFIHLFAGGLPLL